MVQSNYEMYATQLMEAKSDVKLRLQLVTTLRESIEIVHTMEYDHFLKHMFPVFHILLREQPQFVDGDEQQIRTVLLEILNRLPNTETLRPYVTQLCQLVTHILTCDNEDNAVICLRIIFDVHKNFCPLLDAEVPEFINFFINLYKNLPKIVASSFSKPKSATPVVPAGVGRPLTKSSESFKVLIECPLIVMLLFQLYNHYIDPNIQILIPLMIGALSLKTPIQPTAGQRPGQGYDEQLYNSFISAQVKTLSFLTYVFRGFAKRVEPHRDTLASCAIGLLISCPADATNTRKELIVAIRHIIATDFRYGFLKKMDFLLDETIMVEFSRTHDLQRMAPCRPLAYSVLADAIHHFRGELTPQQLSKVLYIFSRSMHDPTLPENIQTASARIILNLVDYIYRLTDPELRGSTLLARLLAALVTKFETLKDYIPKRLDHMRAKAMKAKALAASSSSAAASGGSSTTSPSGSGTGAGTGTSLSSPSPSRVDDDAPEDSIREVKQLMYTMVFGLKTVCWCIHNFLGAPAGGAAAAGVNGAPVPGAAVPKRANVNMDEETALIAQFLDNGLRCLKIYNMPVDSAGVVIWSDEKKDTPHQTTQEEKDILESFAGVFVVLEPRNFRDVFSVKMEILFTQIVENSKLPMLIIPQHFLSSPNVSKAFADILLSFLVKRMADMSTPPNNNPASAAMLNLFRIVFGSVALFPDNEAVLRPYLNQIVSQAMTLATEVKQPMNYFTLLRALFRSIGGGKFELLYKEFLPLLPDLLQGLMKMHVRGPHSIREISIELCLTVPARLSSLLPFIPLLMKAVLLALQARDEQVIKLGLRTLEFWVDNLNPEYLYPHMCEVLNDLLRSLCALLRPFPSPFGPTALSILGKLGGRNRRFLIEEFKLDARAHAEEGLSFQLRFQPPHQQFVLPADPAIELARAVVLDQDVMTHNGQQPTSVVLPSLDAESLKHAKLQAYLFLRTSLTSMLNLTHNITSDINGQIIAPDKNEDHHVDTPSIMKATTAAAAGFMDIPGIFSTSSSSLYGGVSLPMPPICAPLAPGDTPDEKHAVRSRLRRGGEEKIFRDTLFALIVAASDENLVKEATAASETFVHHVARHFALIFASPTQRTIAAEAKEMDPVVFLDAIVDVLCEENSLWTAAAESALKVFVNALITMVGRPAAGRNLAIAELVSRLSHCCYQDVWERRHAGCVGLSLLVNHLSPKWIHTNQMEVMKALLHTFTDTKSDFATQTSSMANATLDKIVKSCCEFVTGDNPMVSLSSGASTGTPAAASESASSSSSSSSSSSVSSTSSARAAPPSAAASAPSPASAAAATSSSVAASSGITPSVTATPSEGGEEKGENYEQGDISITDTDGNFTGAATSSTTAGSTSSTAGAPVSSPSNATTDGFDGSAGATPSAYNVDGTPITTTAGVTTSADGSTATTDGEGKNEVMSDGATAGVTPIVDGSTVSTPAPALDAGDVAATVAAVTGAATSAAASSTSASSSSSSSAHAPVVEDHGPPLNELQQTTVRNFMLILAPELLSGIAAIRECAQRLLQLVSDLTGRSISQILLPYRERFVGPLRGHSMHATPLMARIGYISTATYCLSLSPPFLSVGDLMFLLKEMITDVQEDDRNFGGNMSGRAGRALLHVKLRVEIIKLMSAALSTDEVMRPDENPDAKRKPKDYLDLKHQVIKVFFRSLLSRSKDVIGVARKGLKQVIDREKLPKELLQQCLRPILLNLADFRKLSVSLLDGLSRLLELLSNCFNVTLGEKLLEHLRNFSEVEAITKMRQEIAADKSGGPKLKVEDEVKVCAAIIDLFHLLSPVPGKFLEPLITSVIRLEAMLPQLQFSGGYGQGSSSPYRAPLIKFLNVGPKKTVDFFLKNLTNKKLTQMFQSVVKAPEAEPIRSVLMKFPDMIIATTFYAERTAINQAAAAAAQATAAAAAAGTILPLSSAAAPVLASAQYEDLIIQGITMVHTLSTYQPKWLISCDSVRQCLIEIWDSEGRKNRLQNEEKLPLAQIVESKLIVECFINYCRANKDEVSLLWRLLSVFPIRTLIDFTFVSHFFKYELIETYTITQKKAMIKSWLKLFSDPHTPSAIKMKGSKYIIYPMLKAAFRSRASCELKDKEAKEAAAVAAAQAVADGHESKAVAAPAPTCDYPDILDSEAVDLIVKCCGSEDAADEELRIELLRLVTLLIKWLPSSFALYRRELIRFAWNHFKGENSPSKMWAYLAICHFIDAYETPSKIVLQVYVALLRLYQPEHRVLVRRALDILMPALPRRLPAGDHKYPTWIKWTKKMIVEEGHLIPQLIHIWTLIVRHPALFYPSRAQFMPQMVNTLNRLGLSSNRPAEQRRLATDIAELVVGWDRRCVLERNLSTVDDLDGPTLAGRSVTIVNGLTQFSDIKTVTLAEKIAQLKQESSVGVPVPKRHKSDHPTSSGADGATPAGPASPSSPTEPMSPVTGAAAAVPAGTTSTATMAPYDPVDTSADGESKSDKSGGDALWAGTVTTGDPFASSVTVNLPNSGASASSSSSSSRLDLEYRPNGVMIELIVTYAVRLALVTCEQADMKPLSDRCLSLLRGAIKIWKGADFKFVYIEKILATEAIDPNAAHRDPNAAHRDPNAQMVCALEAVNILMQYQPASFTSSNIPHIAKLVSKCLKTNDGATRKGLYELLDKLLTIFPINRNYAHPPEFLSFHRGLRDHLIGLIKQAATDVVPPLLDKQQVPLLIGLLAVLCKHNPAYLDVPASAAAPPVPTATGATPAPPAPPVANASYPQLLKVINRLSKDHIGKSDAKTQAAVAAARAPLRPGETAPRDNTTADEKVKAAQLTALLSETLVKGLRLLRDHIKDLSTDNKKLYFVTVSTLLDKSTDTAVLMEIATMIQSWVGPDSATSPPGLLPKDKATFIFKMIRFERMDQPELLNVFFNTLLQVFSSNNVKAGSDFLVRLQKPFMIGLRARDRTYRKKFTTIFHRYVSRSLFDRMHYILALQDWEPLSDSYWITQACDMLMSTISEHDYIRDISKNAAIPPFDLTGPRRASTAMTSPVKSDSKRSAALPSMHGNKEKKEKSLMRPSKAASSSAKSKKKDSVKIEVDGSGRVTMKRKHAGVTTATNGHSPIRIKDENGVPMPHVDDGASTRGARISLLRGHASWLVSQRDTRVDSLLTPLRDLMHASPKLTYSLWIHLLPIAWAKLAPEDRALLTPSIEALLAKDWHRKQAFDRPNQIQVLLESFAGCYPLPEIKPELLFFLAKQYNSWHTVISQLERRINAFALDTIVPATANSSQEYLGHLYKLLNERDIWSALWRRRVASDYTKSALALEQFGLWARAQDQWYLALTRVKANDPQAMIATRSEQNLWEEEWVRCARHLNQWDVLGEFARTINHPELTLEASWRNSEWSQLKESSGRYAINETPHGKLFQIYLAVQERRLADREIDKLCDGGMQLALREWQGLPTFVGCAHLDLLQRFQRLVELQESGQMLMDINNYSNRQGALPHFKSFITTWRERLCNKWEEIPVWSDVFTWRTHMFSLISSTPALNTAELTPALSRIHDTPWTMIKLATVARKQQLPAVCLSLIAKVQSTYPHMDALDAFNQRREQIKTCLQSPMDIRAALNLISNCNLDYFAVEQKAEMFRLKGEALQHLGYGDESNTAFSACLSICDTYGKGWLSWGMFCDRVFTLKKDLQWAEHSVVCYLQAIAHKAQRSRQYVPRTLWLVGSDPEPRGPVNKAFNKFSDQVPSWVWLLWIPQLLPSLSRAEGHTVKALLIKIARQYPQALYYGLRAYFLEKREVRAPAQAAAAKAAAAAAAARPAQQAAAAAAAASAAAAAASAPNLSSVPPTTTNGMTSLTSAPAPAPPPQALPPALTPEQQAAAHATAVAQQAVAAATAVAAPAPAPEDPNAAAIAAYQQQQAAATAAANQASTDVAAAAAQAATAAATASAAAGSYPYPQYAQQQAQPSYQYNAQGQPIYNADGTPALAPQQPVAPAPATTDGAQPMDTSSETALAAANAAAAASGQYPGQTQQQYQYSQYYQQQAAAQAAAAAAQRGGAAAPRPSTTGYPATAANYGQYPQGSYPGYAYPAATGAQPMDQSGDAAAAAAAVAASQQPTMVQQPDGTMVATYPTQQPVVAPVPQQAPPPAVPPPVAASSSGVPVPSGIVEEPPIGGYSMLWMEELLTVLRRTSPLLTTEIDGMLDDFARRFKPTPEEELLAAVHQLGYKFLALPMGPQSADEKIDRSMRTTLERLLFKFFTPDPPMGDKRDIPMQSPLAKYKAAFERDFLPPSSRSKASTFPSTVGELVERLKKWKHHLQYKVGARQQVALKLERISSVLSHFQSFDIEVPGQYFQDQEPNLDQNVILTRFEPEVDMQYAHGTSAHGYGSRRVGMRGSDGKIYYFLVQYCQPHYTRSDERMAQFYVLMNHMMIRYKETRKRNLLYHIPLVVPLSPRFRLMDTHPSQVSLEDVYEQSCAIRGVEPDAPILHWRDAMRKVDGGEQNQAARQRVFQDICSTMVPDTILTRYVQRTIPHYDQLWAFKKEFGAQLALAGFMSYILRIGDRAPHKISFFKHSARIINHDFHPPYNEHLLIDCNEQVPLRLTRNLSTLISPFILEGVFPCVLTAANSALISYQEMLRNYLFLFIRDDLLSYIATKTLLPTDEAQRHVERQQKDKVMGNATGILKRLHNLMPSSAPDNAPGKAPQPINVKIHQLVKLAVQKSSLARQPPTWAPWY